MNANGVRRALRRTGIDITLRRTTGTQRLPRDVRCRALVQAGAAAVLVGDVQQTADRITITSDEMDKAKWEGGIVNGDLVIYPDGRVATVRGRAGERWLGTDRVLTFNVQGSS
jgi:hypothetical protein